MASVEWTHISTNSTLQASNIALFCDYFSNFYCEWMGEDLLEKERSLLFFLYFLAYINKKNFVSIVLFLFLRVDN